MRSRKHGTMRAPRHTKNRTELVVWIVTFNPTLRSGNVKSF
ncbi:hypothetical protein [Metallosphaera javensis (ex Hofmann et al. 2022)]|nr:hypothetical protein [Metallosphaera javensis (ex Hofmann et al. 2022)]